MRNRFLLECTLQRQTPRTDAQARLSLGCDSARPLMSKVSSAATSLALALAVLMTSGPNTPARAETLSDALRAAYQNNPQLDAERARLRATDEEVPRAKSGYRPTIQGNVNYGRTDLTTSPRTVSDGRADPSGWGVSINQPLFTGFRTTNAVNEAEALVRAGRQNLRNVESNVLLDAVTAYMDIVRDQSILRLRERNVAVLSRELEAARARRAAREVTLTDVAQAEARRARAVSAADLAKANLRVSRASYRRVIGHAASNVREPGLRVAGLPDTLTRALEISTQESPNVVSSLFREQAARFAVDKVWGEMMPRVDLEANYAHQSNATSLIEDQQSASVLGRLTIPFYQGGEVRARVRQAKHTHVSRLQEIEQARNETEANVTSAWSRLVAARAQLRSDDIAVRAARTALEGVREEERVGQRTLLDVLNAEQEFLDAEVARVSTRRDLVVASYTLLATIGRLEAESIAVADTVYEPEINYQETRNRWLGTTITRSEPMAPPPPPTRPFMRRARHAAPALDAHEEAALVEAEDHGAEVDLAPSVHVERESVVLRGSDYAPVVGSEESYPPAYPQLRPSRDMHPEALLSDLFRQTFR